MSHADTMMMIALGGRKIDQYEDAIGQWEARVRSLEESNRALVERLAEFQDALRIELMHSAGLEAQRAHLKSLGDAAHSAWEPSGLRFKDGQPKTNLRLVYEAAFDAKGRELGIGTPRECRLD